MGVLDVLSGLATAAGGAAQGEAIDQQTAVKNALAQAAAKREQDAANVKAILDQSETNKNNVLARIAGEGKQGRPIIGPNGEIIAWQSIAPLGTGAAAGTGDVGGASAPPPSSAEPPPSSGPGPSVGAGIAPVGTPGTSATPRPAGTPLASGLSIAGNVGPKPANFTERQADNLQSRIKELMAGGASLNDANRQANKEQGHIVPDEPMTEIAMPDGTKRLVPNSQAPGLEKANSSTSAQMVAAMNRLGMSEGDIKNAITQMDAFENDPAMRAKLTTYQQALGAAANTQPNQEGHGALGGLVPAPLVNAGSSLMSGLAQKNVDPDVRTYLRNKQVVGTAATEILPRPNQALLGIESGLSGIDVGWNPDLMQDVQDRRHRMATMLHASLASTPLGQKQQTSSGAAAPSGAPWWQSLVPKKDD